MSSRRGDVTVGCLTSESQHEGREMNRLVNQRKQILNAFQCVVVLHFCNFSHISDAFMESFS